MEKRKSETETQALNAQTKGRDEARRILDESWPRANQAYKEAKKQADIVYKEVRKQIIDKEAKQQADKAHKEALKQAKKLRDAILAEAGAVFRSSYDQATVDYVETTIKSRGRLLNTQTRPIKRLRNWLLISRLKRKQVKSIRRQ